jgi:hypothetical protein
MSRRGRKKKAGIPRTPGGAISRSKYAQLARGERDVAMAQPHRAWLPEEKRADQRAGDLLGCLRLAGQITEAECWAGERYRRIMTDFRRLLASPVMPASAVARMVAPGMETPAEADHLAAERPLTDEERTARVLAYYDEARSEILAFDRLLSGRYAESFDALVCMDKACPADQWPVVKQMLARLADVWGLDVDAPRRMRSTMSRDQRPAWPHEEREIHVHYVDPACKGGPEAA